MRDFTTDHHEGYFGDLNTRIIQSPDHAYTANDDTEHKMTTRPVLVIVAMFGVSAAFADDYVDRADANGDGFVSLHELRAAHYADPEFNKRIEQSFAHYDRDGDGLISEDERRGQRRKIDEPETDTQITKRNAAAEKDERRAARSGGGNSRTESWVREIDADNSGGASIAELVASGDGKQWFADADFHAADRNGDGDLDAAELAGLIRSLERRQR